MVELRGARSRARPSTRSVDRSEAGSSFTIELDMPPSVNKLYVKRRGGGLALSKVANKYREHVKKVLAGRMAELSVFSAEDPEVCYSFDITCHFAQLENPGWFERYTQDGYYTKDSKEKKPNGQPKHLKGELKHRAGDRKAATRYKKIDVDNRVKFVQDCVVRGIGIPDDSQVFEGAQRKVKARDREKVVVTTSVVMRDRFIGGWC